MSIPNKMPPSQKKWFVLIGVDFYIPGYCRWNQDGHILQYPNLRGCVRDICCLEQYIEQTFDPNTTNILKLTSTPNPVNPYKPKEEESEWPTYENIVARLMSVTTYAQPGDIVHIHFSGHGAQAKTVYQGIKGDGGFDEALVTCDVCCGGRYLRDVEVAALLDDMVQKELVVTVVLDSCHSGGAVRGLGGKAGAYTRGTGNVDHSVLRNDWSAIARNLLDSTRLRYRDPCLQQTDRSWLPRPHGYQLLSMAQNWWSSVKDQFQDASSQQTGRSWLLEPHGYELLAACRLNELANEVQAVDGDGLWYGALTHCFLDALKSGGPGALTHAMLHRRIHAEVQLQFPFQTPIFVGNGKRIIFESTEGHHVPTIYVKSVNKTTVLLAAGRAHGILVESEYAMFPWDADDFSDPSGYPKVRITDVLEFESCAEISEDDPYSIRRVKPGYQAVPLQTPVETLRVKLVSIPNPFCGNQREKLDQLRLAMIRNGVMDLPVEPVSDDYGHYSTAAFHIGVDIYGRYILLDTFDQAIPTFPPSESPEELFQRLTHLAKYELIRSLRNLNTPEKLDKKFIFEVVNDAYEPDMPFNIANGGVVTIKFKNLARDPVNLTIFDLRPLLGVTQIYPTASDFETVYPNHERVLQFQLIIPTHTQLGCLSTVPNILKAMITIQAVSFRSLEQLDIDSDMTWRCRGRDNNDALQQLLNMLDVRRRDVQLVTKPTGSGDWATSDITVRINSW